MFLACDVNLRRDSEGCDNVRDKLSPESVSPDWPGFSETRASLKVMGRFVEELLRSIVWRPIHKIKYRKRLNFDAKYQKGTDGS